MSIVLWIVFGLIVGAVANFLAPNSKGGILGSIALGIVGAVVGGFLGETIWGVGVTGFNWTSFLLAVGGSLLLLFLGRVLTRR